MSSRVRWSKSSNCWSVQSRNSGIEPGKAAADLRNERGLGIVHDRTHKLRRQLLAVLVDLGQHDDRVLVARSGLTPSARPPAATTFAPHRWHRTPLTHAVR